MKLTAKQKVLKVKVLILGLAALAAFLGYKYYHTANDLHPKTVVLAEGLGSQEPLVVPRSLHNFLKSDTTFCGTPGDSLFTAIFRVEQVVQGKFADVATQCGAGVDDTFNPHIAILIEGKWKLFDPADYEGEHANPNGPDYWYLNCSFVDAYKIPKGFRYTCYDTKRNKLRDITY